MTLPTKLSLLRILLTFVIMTLLFTAGWQAKAAAFALFVIAALTDWLDGFLARRWNQMTAAGALLDPIADKVLTLGTFLAFVQMRLIPAWMVLVILFRELLITGVRLFAASRRIVLAAAKEGKHKTVSQMGTLIVIFVVVVLLERPEWETFSPSVRLAFATVIAACLWITMILTVTSGALFFWRHRHVLKEAITQ